MAKMNSIRILLSIVANRGLPLWRLDVKNGFLHGDLHKEVYMMLPLGFKILGSEGKVYRLKKTLYGLKESPQAWFERFSGSFKRLNTYKLRLTIFYLLNVHRRGQLQLLFMWMIW